MQGNTLEPNVALGKRGWMIQESQDGQYPASNAFDGDKSDDSFVASPSYIDKDFWLAVDLEKTMAILETVVYPATGRFIIHN